MHRRRRDRISIFEKMKAQAKSSKFQTPNSKLQRSTRHQTQKASCAPFAGVCFGGSGLEIWNFSGAWALVLGVSLGGGSKTEMPGRKSVAIGFLTLSLDLGKPEDSLVEMLLCFVQIRVDPANPGFTPVKVATGLGAQEPP